MVKSRKILLLGGSDQQVVAIDVAKRLGYETVLCDYLPDNPGKNHADRFYQVSTTDKDGVLAVAVQEEVDGVIAYASDPAAPTASYVAEKLGLPGVPYDIACAFCEKHLFRSFLREHGFCVPCFRYVDLNKENGSFGDMDLPLIVKPTDSSGSKGVTVVRDYEMIPSALAGTSVYSRNHVAIVEEYVERSHPHVIEAEIFVSNGEVVSWGLIDSIRDNASNPLLPAAYRYPSGISAEHRGIVRREVSHLIKETGVRCGAFNIEMIIDANSNLFFLDAGPRNGGNRLPDFISMISGSNLVAASIHAAMGDIEHLDVGFDGTEGGFWGLVVLHSAHPGRFSEVVYSDVAKSNLKEEFLQVARGDRVRVFERCDDLIGLAFFCFEDEGAWDAVMSDLDKHVQVIVEGISDAK